LAPVCNGMFRLSIKRITSSIVGGHVHDCRDNVALDVYVIWTWCMLNDCKLESLQRDTQNTLPIDAGCVYILFQKEMAVRF
jgi:hypothetical protein